MLRKIQFGFAVAAALLVGTAAASAHSYVRHPHAAQSYAHATVRHGSHFRRGSYEFWSGWFHERMVNPGESYIGIQDKGNAESMGCPC